MCLRYGPASHGRKRCLAHGCSAPAGLIRVDIMNLPRRQFLHLAAGAAVLPAVSRVGWAQTYPMRPVHVTVGFPAGSTADTLARLIGQWLSERLGQPFIIGQSTGREFQYGHRGGRPCVRGRLHAPLCYIGQRAQCDALRQTQLQLHPRHGTCRKYHPHAPGHGGQSIGCRPRRSQSSLPTPRLIPASSTWRRPATARTCRASYSR